MSLVRGASRLCVVLACGVALGGCDGGVVVDDGGGHFDAGINDDDAGDDADAGQSDGGSSAPSCTRDAESMTAFLRCDSDDQCPCGTGCNLGRCTAECHDDLGDGQGAVACTAPTRCDRFGRCRAQQDDTRYSGIHWQHLSNAELLFHQVLAFDLLVTYDDEYETATAHSSARAA